MWTLIIVSRPLENETIFRLAERMTEDGCQVSFLFIGEGCRHSADTRLVRSLNFSRGIYVLREDCLSPGLPHDLAEGVEAIDYGGWVDLLEACDRVVSWN